ncbi:hypothetical protein LCGC14_2334210 [marine sediment metagenome]|uniref:Uncharacterized protein n=1 Tax=marine sediment metagenome TaxID=412755 RepID=A0A0F9CDU3_9ZZZZ
MRSGVVKKFLIIAKDAKDARRYATDKGIRPKDYKYAASPRGIEGASDMQVVVTEDVDKHKDHAQIMDMIHMCLVTGHLSMFKGVRP